MTARSTISLWLLLAACTGRPIDPDCEQSCEVFDPLPGVGECRDGACTPTFSECVERTEYGTCSAVCEAAGTICAENACADGTYLIYETIEGCQDPSIEGIIQAHSCDEPIEWQFLTSARCCCEQQQ